MTDTKHPEALRQKFERHIVATGRSEGELIFEAGHYLYPDVQEIWELYQAGHAAAKAEDAALLGLMADIRAAAGDPTGKLMQCELVARIAGLRRAKKEPTP